MLHRRFTLAESVHLIGLALRVQREIDHDLGELYLRLAGGDDSVLPAIHDKLNILGRHDEADKLRRIVQS